MRTYPAYSTARRSYCRTLADTRIEESVAALRDFVAEHGSIPTAESWTEAAMRPSEKTIRRRFGSFREAIKRAALA